MYLWRATSREPWSPPQSFVDGLAFSISWVMRDWIPDAKQRRENVNASKIPSKAAKSRSWISQRYCPRLEPSRCAIYPAQGALSAALAYPCVQDQQKEDAGFSTILAKSCGVADLKGWNCTFRAGVGSEMDARIAMAVTLDETSALRILIDSFSMRISLMLGSAEIFHAYGK